MAENRDDTRRAVADDGAKLSSPMLSIVVPFYNEETTVEPFFAALAPVLEGLGLEIEIVCVNDGSRDDTLPRLLAQQRRAPAIRILDLSRNFGKEAAVAAGIDNARGRAVIPMDCDLQDPPALLPAMVRRWREGYEIVLCRRARRLGDGLIRRWTAAGFYRVNAAISNIEVPVDVGDYRLLDRKVVDVLDQLPERHRFLKGLTAWSGFRTITIDYDRAPRVVGASRFNSMKLWNTALDGITAFSTVPLRIWTVIGAVISLTAFGYATFIILRTLIHGTDTPGYASVMVTVLFLGGLQLVSLGVLGEYVGRIHEEVKHRPVYVVRQVYPAAPEPAAEPADDRRHAS